MPLRHTDGWFSYKHNSLPDQGRPISIPFYTKAGQRTSGINVCVRRLFSSLTTAVAACDKMDYTVLLWCLSLAGGLLRSAATRALSRRGKDYAGMNTSIVRAFSLFALFTLFSVDITAVGMHNAAARRTAACRSFAETGKTLCNRFLSYWEQNGGLPQQGYPISGEFREQSEIDGKAYTVQYFERAVFELHPENKPPYDVLLSLLGSMAYKQKYPTGALGQQ